jgi:hypothetical protein
MPASKNSFLDHMRWFRAACRSAGAEAIVSLETWQAFVRRGEQHLAFFPQFQAWVQGRIQYQQGLTDDASMFAGWLPYRLKRWDIAVDKLAFKRYARAVGLQVPRHWLAAAEVPAGTPVVAKSPRSSFGIQVDGPYREAVERPLDAAQGEYYEEYLEGRLLKIWFWDGEPVCAELDRLPVFKGNGATSLRRAMLRRVERHRLLKAAQREELVARCEPLLRFHGRSLSDVLPAGETQVIDFRYGSQLMLGTERTVVDLGGGEPPAWLPAVQNAGRLLHAAIPAEIRAGTMFTVDAILAGEDRVYLLEANCNPTVHPMVYPVMVRHLLPAAASAPAEAVH